MKILVRRNEKYNYFEYKTEGGGSFKILPDWCDSPIMIQRYFTSRGYNSPEIASVSASGKPCRHYTFKRGQQLNGQLYAIVDGDKKFLPDLSGIISTEEKIEFLKGFADQEEGKFKLHELTIERTTPDVLKRLCEENSAGYNDNLPAEVEFIDS